MLPSLWIIDNTVTLTFLQIRGITDHKNFRGQAPKEDEARCQLQDVESMEYIPMMSHEYVMKMLWNL